MKEFGKLRKFMDAGSDLPWGCRGVGTTPSGV
jgi:hypothetical protein